MTFFLVTGATGNLGGAALRGLLKRVSLEQVRVLVRTEHAADQFAGRPYRGLF